MPNKSAIYKILEINSIYDKKLCRLQTNINDKNLNDFIKENNLDTLLKNKIKEKKKIYIYIIRIFRQWFY